MAEGSRTGSDDGGRAVIGLGQDGSTEIAVVGGKGASLGRMVRAGFPVPSGFVVTTAGYDRCLVANDLRAGINALLRDLDYGNVGELEARTAKIRQAIVGCELPEGLAAEIVRAYGELGDEPYVAVRSSGTAEDLAGASFAGQYDTYLDVRGGDALLDAVRRCWASMWTARVTAYRQGKGFDHGDVGIAVVIQTMLEPDVAGVMFVGNPMNARADETVINASWGLGEAVVSGSVTPDEYVVARKTSTVEQRKLGAKELQVVRDPQAASGTVEQPVATERRGRYTLSDAQAVELAELGQRVTAYYQGLPQDIEWALSDGSLFLLQSRPVTGVEFTWDEDLDLWPSLPDEDDAIWTRSWADEVWTGGVTPLMWSIRGYWIHGVASGNYAPFGMGDLASMRWLKYRQGTVYYNTRVDMLMAEHTLPPSLREPMLARLHPSQVEEAMAAPFDLARCLKMFARVETDHPEMGLGSISRKLGMERKLRKGGELYEQRSAGMQTMLPSQQELRALGDAELKSSVEAIFKGIAAGGARAGGWSAFFLYGPVIQALLEGVLKHWYDGDNRNAFAEVISGLPERTQQFHDDYDFWKLAETIRKSKKLRGLIHELEGSAFFEELENHEEGRAFLDQYEEFMKMNFFRGHADRDIYFTRRIEDPQVDYEALRLLSSVDEVADPGEREEKLAKRREAATAEVVENLAGQPLGDVKVSVFKFLVGYCLQMLMSRDDGRSMGDAMTYRKKVLLGELGRRAVDRGLLEADRDFFFLSLDELCGLLAGSEPPALCRAKAAARALSFDRFLAHQVETPLFLDGRKPMQADPSDGGADGVLQGSGTSPGTVTARARIVPALQDIGKLQKGDILVCHGTDPGWTSAFSIVSGVVAETGGMLAHFACLSREYGLPAVSLPSAIRLIEDGSMITVDGDSGEVRRGSEPS